MVPYEQAPAMKVSFDRVDLNLLKALHALLEERSVTHAANRLFITQSAMSKSLHRLRGLYDDALLVRAGAKLVPTPLAEDLLESVREIVVKVEACLAPSAFDPARATAHVRIAAPEQFAFVTDSALMARLRAKAPGVLLDIQHLPGHYRDMLAAGSLDFAVTHKQGESPDFVAAEIYSAEPQCWCRLGHPITKQSNVTLSDICAQPLVALQSQNASQNFPVEVVEEVRTEISAQSLKTNVILRTSHVITAIDTLLRFDALMFAPDFISRIPLAGVSIEAIALAHIPVLNRLRTNVVLVQHKRTVASPLHRWLAGEIRDAATTGTEPFQP